MPLHAQAQGLHPLHGHPAVEGRGGHAEITQHLHPRLENEGRRSERAVHQAVVGRVRLGEAGEPARGPVEGTAVDQEAAQTGAVAVEELGGAVRDHVRPPFERPAQVGRGQGVVDDQRQPVLAGDGAHCLEGEHGQSRVAQGFTVDEPGVRPDGAGECLRVGRVDKGGVDAQAGEGVAQLVVGAAVQAAAGNDVVARGAQGEKGKRLRTVAAARRQAGDAALQACHPLLEHVGGRVHDAGVDVAGLLEGEQVGRVLAVAEQVGAGLVEGQGPAAGEGVDGLAGMELAGGKAVAAGLIGHEQYSLKGDRRLRGCGRLGPGPRTLSSPRQRRDGHCTRSGGKERVFPARPRPPRACRPLAGTVSGGREKRLTVPLFSAMLRTILPGPVGTVSSPAMECTACRSAFSRKSRQRKTG